MTEAATAPSGTGPVVTCEIPTSGANQPRAIATTGALPVVLRDRIRNKKHFEAFGCDVRKVKQGVTPDRVTPDVEFVREVHSGGQVQMPDGKRVDFWSFRDPTDKKNDKPFPAPIIRVREGQIVHTTLWASKNTHTIHHHGIEPTPHNDGVGHTSFEVDKTYTYQWRASESGSFFYHCHKNTTLHFELGMYGPLVIDPPQGPGFVRRGTQVVPYDHEVVWIPDDVDPAWRSLGHSAGLRCGPFDDTQHMLRFEPRYWLLSGVPHPRTRTDSKVTARCRRGERLLIRLLNAAYGPVEVRLPFDAECIGMDGHTLGGPKGDRYSRPWTIPAGQSCELSTAQRWDLLVQPDRVGTFPVTMDVKHWVQGTPQGRIETAIIVS